MKELILFCCALCWACSGVAGSAWSPEVGAPATGVHVGRELASDARAADAERVFSRDSNGVADGAMATDMAALVDAWPAADVAAVPDVSRPGDVVSQDVQIVPDAAPWGRVDDAGVLHCRGIPSDPLRCAGYEIGTPDRHVSCLLDLTGTIRAACRWGIETQSNYSWYVKVCSDCAGLENWGGS